MRGQLNCFIGLNRNHSCPSFTANITHPLLKKRNKMLPRQRQNNLTLSNFAVHSGTWRIYQTMTWSISHSRKLKTLFRCLLSRLNQDSQSQKSPGKHHSPTLYPTHWELTPSLFVTHQRGLSDSSQHSFSTWKSWEETKAEKVEQITGASSFLP